ncbi:fimbria/pilus periplasmic chaperone [Acinetobacter gerneri]|uniref:fimbria/pilus periplasmic chaperone n=1 Tax=Acinetobacter gerneri TaxID=202952 RepID=UPI002935ED1D|nr:fimbria/pilus periplasmic chaperone [Acinetobacter gerneri]MDV2441630.1 fimbria/pilus periplasmic chaperone [Acinetobacter gerneri]
MFAKSLSLVVALSTLTTVSMLTNAALVISGTRVIYPSDKKNVVVQVRNEGATPSLMQVWMDDGDANVSPDKSEVPFVITPPISRVDPKVGQAINIAYLNKALPQDRETVFFLNVLDIPAKPKTEAGQEGNYLQFTFKSRLKVFYRPINLQGNANDAPKALKWSLVANQLNVNNPTPFYVNIATIRTEANSNAENLAGDGLMLAPFSSKTVVLKNANINKIYIKSINDFGGDNNLEVSLTH